MNDRFKFRYYNKEGMHEWEFPLQERVMQCTGLKDKNGKLIYEGDIVKVNEFNKPVKVEFYGIGFRLIRNPDNTVGYENRDYIPEDVEIIGNIYENKELLEEECQK